MTNVQTEEDEKEDAPEAEGAQAEEFTQDLSDFQKEDGKEHTKKKDIVKYEECLKAKEGNKDSEKPKEFGQEKVKNLDSMEVKTVLKEKDGEKDQYGHKNIRPLMIICDGSLVLMHAISLVFCQTNLNALLQSYFRILTGKGTAEDFDLPILHRCLSHIMKNAKSLCKKHAPKNYKLAMHIFGLLTTARSIAEFDDMLLSCTVIFSSPCSSENVEIHFNNIQALLTTVGESVVDDNSIVSEDLEDTFSQTPFHRHFMEVIGTAPLNKQGDPNVYYTETFISSMAAYFLSHAALWTSMMLGDLGRHGERPQYQLFSKKFSKISKKKCQV
ncbi:hypothetical protein E1301_Tti014479 [Triplophysa tibetana]|uniref:Uncharacterized protein n=1 Tax=Triplophysa tibetana TaxID=1572043 RepID=A0A5A9PKC9_9TELE|nr:hypothetical protein E1301_Tti014479 [Triplophysa tibetana]